jgi:heme/copper-type cytochrome/quinol oxidase subunit 4
MDEVIRAHDEHMHSHEHSTREHSGRKHEPLSHAERIERWIEIITAIMLGVVALATAWSGYQAARWGSVQATKFAQASALRLEASRDTTLAGQDRIYDLLLANEWINAYVAGNIPLANMYLARMRPEFRPVFEAWLALDPFHNPSAPPGPLFMPQYKLALETQAAQLDAQAQSTFNQGQAAIEQSDAYVLNTVFLATVLFLTAIAGRFEWNVMKAVILAIALALLLFGVYHLLTYPVT